MGQRPNISRTFAELPRPVPTPGAPRRWSPGRPGDLVSPEDVPWGGLFGTPGPDAGYALRLLAERTLAIGPGEKRADVAAALAAVAVARASRYGRAPTPEDIEVAEVLFGLSADLPEAVAEELSSARPGLVAGLAHDPAAATQLANGIAREVLMLAPHEIRARVVAGERLIGR